MKITEVRVTPLNQPKAGLLAFASVVLDDALVLNSIGIYARKDGAGYRITYPTKASRSHDCYVYRPINEEMGTAIALAVLNKASTLLSQKEVKDYVGHSNTHNA